MMRPLSVVGAPSSAGAYAPGQERAPEAFRRHGLVPALQRAGLEVADRGNTAGFRWRPDSANLQAMNLGAAARVAREVATRVAERLAQDHDVLVLGGDCTIEIGVVAGAVGEFGSLGLIYLDADTDLNVPATSDGALDWTGVAHLLDLPGAADELAGLAHKRPLLGNDQVLFFAAGNITSPEAETIRRRDLPVIGLDAVKANPGGAAEQAARWAERFDCVLVHLDIDVLDFADFPLAENTRRNFGLTFDELAAALPILLASPNRRVLTVTEVNPDHAPDAEESFGRLIGLLSTALAR